METCDGNAQKQGVQNADVPVRTPTVVEVAFKAGRVGIYANPQKLDLKTEDYVIIEADKGQDLGKVILTGDVFDDQVEVQELKRVVRVAVAGDFDKLAKNRDLEEKAIRICKDKILKHGLKMNLVDTEYQWDHNKLTFYFTSDERVDFRALVRDLASRFRTRIELRQIGVRDAARYVGGYGACGCQLCCTLFLRKFENITTQYIKDQLIPMSPSRLTGICGRLKCCLAYERDFYTDELIKYPSVGVEVQTPQGTGTVEKIDIFNAVIYVRNEEGDIVKFAWQDIHEMAMSET